MTEVSGKQTKISIDLKKFRIRVHKEALHLLGDPSYIQLLVSRNLKMVAIRAVERGNTDIQVHKVSRASMASDFSFEIYSRPFLQKLCSVFDGLQEGYSYCITGTVIPMERAAVFSLDALEEIDEQGRIYGK